MEPTNHDSLREERIDRLLDGVLRAHGHAEPAPGFEARTARAVQRRLAEQPSRSSFGWPAWAAVAALLVVAVGASWMFLTRESAPTGSPSPTAVVREKPVEPFAAPVVSEPATATAPVVRRATKRAAARPSLPPRQPVFPSPAPLSEQEKLLIAYANRMPPTAAATKPFGGDREQADVPALEFAPVQVPSLPAMWAGPDATDVSTK